MVVLAIVSQAGMAIYIQNTYILQEGQIAALSMMKEVEGNQSPTRQLADLPCLPPRPRGNDVIRAQHCF